MSDRLALRDGEVDLRTGVVRRTAGEVRLTTRERDLLRYLLARAHRVVPRDELMREVWEYRDPSRSRAVDFTVHRLRAKIEADPTEPRHLLTNHGVGYQLVPADPDLDGPPAGWVTLVAAVGRELDPADVAGALAVSEAVLGATDGGVGHAARGDGVHWLAAFATTAAATRCATRLAAAGLPIGIGVATGTELPVREPISGRADYRGPAAVRALAIGRASPRGAVLL
ncbi:MAG: winged helix-turn-helix domain-containing protein, partial [Myxococcota bacterium]